MISLPCLVVPETANIRLCFTLFLNFNCHNFDLIVSKTNLDFKHSWHNKFISFNRIKIVLLLLFSSRTRNVYLILLPIKLNDIIFLTFTCITIVTAVTCTVLPLEPVCIPLRSSFIDDVHHPSVNVQHHLDSSHCGGDQGMHLPFHDDDLHRPFPPLFEF